MIKLLSLLIIVFISCNHAKKKYNFVLDRTHQIVHYSKVVKDSFVIDVYLPDTSGDNGKPGYPVVYILDGNLYFEIYASILKQYNNVGLLPKLILVGISYPTFQKMDSLRQRDYTYPKAIAEYEMPVSGGGNIFRKAFIDEFVPLVDSLFSTDTSKRILMGHSLGGYFSLYTMYQDNLENKSLWLGYIAASPSLHYNNSYLVKRIDSLATIRNSPSKVFISYGLLEAGEIEKEVRMSLDSLLKKCTVTMERNKGVEVQSALFSNMDHMDTQIPTFIKGLQWMLHDTWEN